MNKKFIIVLFIHRHGTRCAGEVGKLNKKILFIEIMILFLAAAANNNICSVGVAYDARIGGKLLSLEICNDQIGCLF